MRRVLEAVVRFLGSFRLAVALFIALLVVVLVGTLEQQRMSLYDVQRTYFASLYFTRRVFGAISIPFPGGALLLAVLLINLVIGGLMRMRWSKSKAGVLITHLGIVFLLVGGFVEYRWSKKGFLQLYEKQSGARFQSYDDWDLAIVRDGAERREWFVASEVVSAAASPVRVRASAPDLPFEVVLSGHARNTAVRAAASPTDGIDGVEMVEAEAPLDPDSPSVPGLVVSLEPPAPAPPVKGYVRAPVRTKSSSPAMAFTTELLGATWHVALVSRTWPIPFETRLDRFVHKEHPGTRAPKEFSSYVSVTDGGVARDVHITMNEPLRLRGMTLYQSQWGQDERGTYSVFAVVFNPSDQVPKWACWVIFLGMLVHFGTKLERHLRAERARRGAVPPAGDAAAAGSTT